MTEFHYIQTGDAELATSIDRPQRPGTVPTVFVVHGLTGQRLGRSYHLVEFGRRLAAAGIACVRFDQAGCGESTGDFRELTIPRMIDDSLAVVRWARGQAWCDSERIAYVGLSLGGLASIAAEAETGSRAVALWAPVYDMPRVFRFTAKTGLRALLEHQGWVPYRGLQIGRCFVDALGHCDTGQLLSRSDAPMRVYHSDVDEVVPIEESRSYVARCAEIGRPCTLERFTTANHDFLEYPDRQRLIGDTIDFVRQHLDAAAPAEAATRHASA